MITRLISGETGILRVHYETRECTRNPHPLLSRPLAHFVVALLFLIAMLIYKPLNLDFRKMAEIDQ